MARRSHFSLKRGFLRDCSGNVAILFAFGLPVVAGGAAFGLETGIWYLDQSKLQQAADAAAYAAGLENRMGSSSSVMSAAAQAAAISNGYDSTTDTLALVSPAVINGVANANATSVVLTRREPRFFSQVFDDSTITIRAAALANFATAANACILALDPSATKAVYFSGNSHIGFVGCNVMANSVSASSIYSQGSTQVSVPCLMTVGGVSLNAPVTQTACAAAMTQLPPVADPFRTVPEPIVTGSCQNSNGNNLQPGRYCNGLTLQNSVNLKPGVFIIDGGTLKMNANANVSGSGVTIVLANNAGVSLNGNATMNLSAPTTGTYKGLLFFGSRKNSTSTAVTLNGTASSVMTGAIYFSKQNVSYLGNFQGANGCTQVVARTIDWSGNTNLAVNCTNYGMSPLPVGGVVKLAE